MVRVEMGQEPVPAADARRARPKLVHHERRAGDGLPRRQPPACAPRLLRVADALLLVPVHVSGIMCVGSTYQGCAFCSEHVISQQLWHRTAGAHNTAALHSAPV